MSKLEELNEAKDRLETVTNLVNTGFNIKFCGYRYPHGLIVESSILGNQNYEVLKDLINEFSKKVTNIMEAEYNEASTKYHTLDETPVELFQDREKNYIENYIMPELAKMLSIKQRISFLEALVKEKKIDRLEYNDSLHEKMEVKIWINGKEATIKRYKFN